MEQFVELSKALYVSMQQQQQQLQQQVEKFEKSQKIFQDELVQLLKQQTKDTKLLFEAVLSKSSIEEQGSRFFSSEGISTSLSEFKCDPGNDFFKKMCPMV